MMERLASSFEKFFGIPFESLPLPSGPLVEITSAEYCGLLWGAEPTVSDSLLMDSGPEELKVARPGLFVVGFWDHGVNSFSFYYIRVDTRRRLLFRLPYGGIYTNEPRARKDARDWLLEWFDFERELPEAFRTWMAVYCRGASHFRFESFSGEVFDHQRVRIYGAPDLPARLRALIHPD